MKAKITNVKPAGPTAQVVTVTGGGARYRREVCEQCPWRIDQTGSFPAEAFRHSANTAYDMATHTFACHMNGADKPATCAGFLLRGSTHNLAVRLRLVRELIDLGQVRETVPLHDSYRAMAIANGVDATDPVLEPCR